MDISLYYTILNILTAENRGKRKGKQVKKGEGEQFREKSK